MHFKRKHVFIMLSLLLLGFFALFLAFVPLSSNEGTAKGSNNYASVLVLVLDGVGANYLEGIAQEELWLDGIALEKAKLELPEEYMHYAVLEQPYPKTIAAHSLFYIAGDCGKRWDDIEYCVDDYGIVSICDAYRAKGYLCIMVSEAGDFKDARKEFDVALYDAGLFNFKVELNSKSSYAKLVAEFLKERISEASNYKLKDKDANFFINYSKFIIDTDLKLINFMRKNMPEKKFFIFSNAKGTDRCGHELNAIEYTNCIQGLSDSLRKIALASLDSNIIMVITADHGMVFDCLACSGHHSSEPYSDSVFAKQIPFIVISDKNFSLANGTAYDLMPSIFELSGLTNACNEMRYCKGSSLVRSH